MTTTLPTTLPPDIQTQAISMIRGFAMDAPLHAKSGHQGTAMALAPLAHVLYSRVMRHHPADPAWPDRDRFVLSNGHASILQYSMLYLCGYGLELDDLRAFRSFGSRTPGHPEAGHTVGIEVTTGPLGQGFADAVGMAIAERVLRDRFGSELIDHNTWVIAGDGCLMEGVSHEAASLAGHLGLGRLNVVYDDNRITIDGPTQLAFTDDVRPALRGLRLARGVPRRDRRRPRRAGAGAARRQGRRGPSEHAHPALTRRHPIAEVDRPPRGARQPVHTPRMSPRRRP